jgi:hypothetical protein
MFCLHFWLTRSWALTGTRFRTGTIHQLDIDPVNREILQFLTIEVQVIAAVEETKAIATGATTDSVGQNTVQKAVVDNAAGTRGDHLVAAGDNGVIATLSVGLLEGDIAGDGLDLAVRAVAGGKGQSGGSEEEGSGEELHFDGLKVDKHEK